MRFPSVPISGSLVKLYPDQVRAYGEMVDIMAKSYTILNVSPLGSGKTVMTIAAAGHFGAGLVVICPLTVKKVWERESIKYKTPLKSSISYASLRGSRDGLLKHGLLIRNGDTFSASEHLKELISSPEGVFVIFDECHNLKNMNSLQHKAACTIVRAIKEAQSSSRAIFLSGSVFAKESFSYSVFKYLGITDRGNPTTLIRYAPRLRKPAGLADIYTMCNGIDPDRANSIYTWDKLDKKTVDKICFELYTQILSSHLSFYVKPSPSRRVPDYKNGFYDVTNPSQIRDAVLSLRRAVVIKGDTLYNEIRFSDVTLALLELERSKIPTVVRLTKETLQSNPTSKVIIFYWYNKVTLHRLYDELSMYSPLYLYGDVPEQTRVDVVNAFQSHSTDNRLLIVNARTGGTGLSLDDTDGSYPRYAFCMPSYFFIDMFQCAGRINRYTTKSVPTFRVIYSKEEEGESKIISNLAMKTGNTKLVLGYGPDMDVMFPGEYESYYEGSEVGVV